MRVRAAATATGGGGAVSGSGSSVSAWYWAPMRGARGGTLRRRDGRRRGRRAGAGREADRQLAAAAAPRPRAGRGTGAAPRAPGERTRGAFGAVSSTRLLAPRVVAPPSAGRFFRSNAACAVRGAAAASASTLRL